MKRITIRDGLLLLVVGAISPQLWAVDIAATTQWYRLLELSPIRSGVVESVPVDVGTQLNKGELILQLEHKLESAQLLATREKLREAELLFNEAKREYERIEDLYDRTLISDHDRAIGEAAWAGASADLHLAKSEQNRAERGLQLSQISAPFKALVVARDVDAGSIFNHSYQQPPLIKIASTTSIAVDGYVNASQAAKLAKGQSAKVKLAGKVVKGRIDSVALLSSPEQGGKYQVRVVLPYKKALRAGMKAVIVVD